MPMIVLTPNRRWVLTGTTLALTGVAGPVLSQERAGYDGLKKTIAVDLFRATEAVGGSVTADGMTAMLIQALAADGRFLVIEGGDGGSMAASAIVRGAVTKYEPAAGGGGLSISGGPLGGLLGGRAGTRSRYGPVRRLSERGGRQERNAGHDAERLASGPHSDRPRHGRGAGRRNEPDRAGAGRDRA